MEYVIGMLTHMGILSWSDVQPLLDAFERMDADGSGGLDRKDLEVAAQIQAEKEAAAKVQAEKDAATKRSHSSKRWRLSPKGSPSASRHTFEAAISISTSANVTNDSESSASLSPNLNPGLASLSIDPNASI